MKKAIHWIKRLIIVPIALLTGIAASLLHGCERPPVVCDPPHEPYDGQDDEGNGEETDGADESR